MRRERKGKKMKKEDGRMILQNIGRIIFTSVLTHISLSNIFLNMEEKKTERRK